MPTTSHQARALAASRSSSYRFCKPLPAWLANLAVGGVTAAIVTANLEEVPLTGRMQLRLDCFQPRPREPGVLPRHVKSHPACQNAASHSSCRQHQPLSEQASDVMFETYKDVVRGAELLAPASAADCPHCPKHLNYSMMQTSSRALPALVTVPLGLGTDF